MRRGRILIFVILILIVGAAVAFFGLQQFLQGRKDTHAVEVYVAGQTFRREISGVSSTTTFHR
jgi:hypothetical protein